jgi:hypoxanthine phosphoribosyltransferase
MTTETATQLEVPTWEGFGDASKVLAEEIAKSGRLPDLVLCIARGGLPVGGALAYALGVKNCASISVEFYTGVGETLPIPVVLPLTPPLVDFAGLDILVADDVADSGQTLETVMRLVRPHVAQLRSAVLYTKPRSVFVPDFTWKTTERWVDFPWSSVGPPVPTEAPAVSTIGAKPETKASVADEAVALATLQFGFGGLLDFRPADGYKVHLVREKANGRTPGPTLCGIDRFHPKSAGWSVRGGATGPGIAYTPCEGCAAARTADFPALSVYGLGKEVYPEGKATTPTNNSPPAEPQ